MTTLEKQIDVGCCRICLLNKVNCHFCKFSFALPIIEAEKIEIVKFFVTIKQGGVKIANMVQCEAQSNKKIEVALTLKNEIAQQWNISPDTCTYAIFETIESYIPQYKSFSWQD